METEKNPTRGRVLKVNSYYKNVAKTLVTEHDDASPAPTQSKRTDREVSK